MQDFPRVEPAIVLWVLLGALFAAVGVYLLAFRPVTRPCLLLGGALAATGISIAWVPFEYLDGSTNLTRLLIDVVAQLLFAAFVATFPKPLQWRSFSAFALSLVLARQAGSFVYAATNEMLIGGWNYDFWGFLWHPTSFGHAAFFGLFLLARFADLPRTLDHRAAAAKVFYVVTAGVAFGTGGYHLGNYLVALTGATDFGDMGPKGDPRLTALMVACWWALPIAIAAVSFARWRWWLPTLLFVAGALSYLPLLFRTRLDLEPLNILASVVWRNWGLFIAPLLVLYAQARWAAFRGEPRGVKPSVAVAATAAALAYAYALLMVWIIAPNTVIVYVVGPAIALVATIGVTLLVLPRARKLGLRRAFVSDAAGPTPLVPGQLLLGRYRITRLLAEGGQGHVYEATDRKTGKRVVVKAAPNDVTAAEARILRDLRHPNVVGFVDVIEVTGFTLLVLEYVEGGTLRGRLDREGGKVPPREVRRISRGILAGLGAVHAAGIAHRDIKPENILLDGSDTPKLADFGTAREAQPGATARVLGLGTLAYVAPEQLRGAVGDARSDVYSAAVLIHELATGNLPLRMGEDDFVNRQAVLTKEPRVSLPKDHAGIEPVLRRALSKSPADRFGTASEMLQSFGGHDALRPGQVKRRVRAVLVRAPTRNPAVNQS